MCQHRGGNPDPGERAREVRAREDEGGRSKEWRSRDKDFPLLAVGLVQPSCAIALLIDLSNLIQVFNGLIDTKKGDLLQS